MARPIKRRTVKSLSRDIDALYRTRLSLAQDPTLDHAKASKAILAIDSVLVALDALVQDSRVRESA